MDRFGKQAESLDVRARLFIHEPRDPHQLPELAHKYDLGLAVFGAIDDVEMRHSRKLDIRASLSKNQEPAKII